MQVGDLVSVKGRELAVVLYVNEEGGTIKALLSDGVIGWIVKSGCKVINESR